VRCPSAWLDRLHRYYCPTPCQCSTVTRADVCTVDAPICCAVGRPHHCPSPPASLPRPSCPFASPPDLVPLPAGCVATPGAFGVARAEAVRCGAFELVAAYLAR
jgi:hypothetical protein